jgi:toxin ParE1/3/4
VSHRIEFSPEALADLLDLYDYIAMRDGPERAIGYIDRIEGCCRNLSAFPGRGERFAFFCAAGDPVTGVL